MVPVAVERGQHHVCGVQGVDEVWRERILLFNNVRPPEKAQKNQTYKHLVVCVMALDMMRYLRKTRRPHYEPHS